MSTTNWGSGALQKLFLGIETTTNTYQAAAGSDAARFVTLDIQGDEGREYREDNTESYGYEEIVTGRKSYPWTLNGLILPSGTAGTPPDLHALFLAMMGSYTNTPGTSDEYAFNNNVRQSTMWMAHHIPLTTMRHMLGCVPQSMNIEITGTGVAKVSASGFAMTEIRTQQSSVDGAAGAGATFDVQTGEGIGFEVNSVIAFYNPSTGAVVDDNSSAGYTVTNVSTDTITVTPSHGGVSDLDEVRPFTPASSGLVGNPVAVGVGSLSIGGTAVEVTKCSVSINNGVQEVNDEFTTTGPSDHFKSKREATIALELRMRADRAHIWRKSRAVTTQAFQVIVGNTAGKRLQIDAASLNLDFGNPSVPQNEVVTISASGKCLDSSGNDSLKLTFT